MEKIDIAAVLMTGLHDTELTSLENKLKSITVENQVIFEYTNAIKNINENLERGIGKQEEDQSSENIDDDSEIADLKNVYKMLYKIYRKIPKRTDAIIALEESEKKLNLSLPERKQEYERLCKQHEAVMNDAKLKEKIAVIETLKQEVEEEEQRLAALTKENDEICAKLFEKEGQKRKLLEDTKQELAEVENQISGLESYLANDDEEVLAAEIAELEKQWSKIQVNLDDDISSECSSSVDVPPSAPVFEKLTTDVESFFKDPNDFQVSPIPKVVKSPNPKSLGKHIHFETPVIASKKARLRVSPRLGSTSPQILTTSNQQENLATPLLKPTSPVVPSPIVITPPSDKSTKKSPIVVISVETLPKLPDMVQPIADDTLKSTASNQDQNIYKPRSLDKEYGTPNKDVEMAVEAEPNVQKPSLHYSPPTEKLPPIQETPEDNPQAEVPSTVKSPENAAGKETPMEAEIDPFEDQLFRRNSVTSLNESFLNDHQGLMEIDESNNQNDSFSFSDNGNNEDNGGFMDFDNDNNDGFLLDSTNNKDENPNDSLF